MPNELVVAATDLLKSPIVQFGGAYIAGAYSDVAKDLAGLAGGNYVKLWCLQQQDRLFRSADELRAQRNATRIDLNPVIGLPLLEAATPETREEILRLWTELLTAAISEDRASRVRLKYIDIIKKMDPLDALIFDEIRIGTTYTPNMKTALASRLARSEDDIEVSFINLTELGVTYTTNTSHRSEIADIGLTVIGRQLQSLLR